MGKETGKVKARVLVDGPHGKCNDVVLVTKEELEASKVELDSNIDAVKYAESLKNQTERAVQNSTEKETR